MRQRLENHQALTLAAGSLLQDKLRHRSFRIDVERLNSAEECEQKLWRKISKLVVPGSLQSAQIRGLIDKLFGQVEEEAQGANHITPIHSCHPTSPKLLVSCDPEHPEQHRATRNSPPALLRTARLMRRRVQNKNVHWRRSARSRRK